MTLVKAQFPPGEYLDSSLAEACDMCRAEYAWGEGATL